MLNMTLPVTVPITATAGVITVTGAATIKPTLTWTDIALPGNLTTPAGTAADTAYYVSPFDSPNLRLATIAYDCLATQVLSLSSRTVSYSPLTPTITPVLSNQDGILTFTIQLDNITSNTIATAILGGAGATTATLGAIPTTRNLVTAGTAITITNTWNVDISVTPEEYPAPPNGFGTNWIKFNGNNGTAVVEPGASFTISADANATGSNRTVNARIECINTRIFPALASQTITITQA